MEICTKIYQNVLHLYKIRSMHQYQEYTSQFQHYLLFLNSSLKNSFIFEKPKKKNRRSTEPVKLSLSTDGCTSKQFHFECEFLFSFHLYSKGNEQTQTKEKRQILSTKIQSKITKFGSWKKTENKKKKQKIITCYCLSIHRK